MHAHIPNPKFMVMAETSTFDVSSVAEMSRPKRPRPKCPWPKCPSTVGSYMLFMCHSQIIWFLAICHQRFIRFFAAARRLAPAIYMYPTFRCCQTSVTSDLSDFSLLPDAWQQPLRNYYLLFQWTHPCHRKRYNHQQNVVNESRVLGEEHDTLLEGLLTSLELQPYDQAGGELVLPGSEEFGYPWA